MRLAPNGHAIHDVHDGVNNAPGDITADRGMEELPRARFARVRSQPGGKRDRQHHDQAEEDFAQPAGGIEVPLRRSFLWLS